MAAVRLALPLLLLSMHAVVTVSGQAAVVTGQQCLQGSHHPARSFTGTAANFSGVCSLYRPNSCCTTKTARSIHRLGDRELYNFHVDDCGTIPEACDRYLKLESCFYECDPYIQGWQDPVNAYAVKRVPICASFCDNWYEACKSVQICTDDFANGFQKRADGRYHCPTNKTCRTFAEWYGSGRELCNRQWATSFQYSTNNSSCLTMEFTGRNPNACSRPPNATQGRVAHTANCNAFRQGSGGGSRLHVSVVHLVVAILTLAAILA